MSENSITDWFANRGDSTHRLNYNLSTDSIVFDLGGYEGDFTKKIYEKFKCNVYCFEPVEKFYEKLNEQFKHINKIKVFNYGISELDREEEISLLNDGSSIFRDGKEKQKILLKNFSNVLEDLNITKIDLIKINIEGGEYSLLEYCLKNNITNNIKNIQVQFHDFIVNCRERRDNIHKNLLKTHHITYNYPFVWENWEINK